MKTFVVFQTVVTTYACTVSAKSEQDARKLAVPNPERRMPREVRRTVERSSVVSSAPVRNT